ncbi:hypothetical protein [uncultured Microbacterium sp.]|jgi:hemin uptake protein HemP|uniref:hypothetical protein n=1 Tax=uncultured Microbacterium sp. TaxID=191216 RepID=UPI0025E52955|nr:hypothetical protein [uncultured Microbacterium sp.]
MLRIIDPTERLPDPAYRVPWRRAGPSSRDFELVNREIESADRHLALVNEDVESANGQVESANRRVESAHRHVESANRQLETDNSESANRRVELVNDSRDALSSVTVAAVPTGVLLLPGARRVAPGHTLAFRLDGDHDVAVVAWSVDGARYLLRVTI